MKRLITVFSILLIILGGILLNLSYASYQDTYTLEFKASDVTEDFDLYILLPKDYILFAIKEDDLNIEYKGVETLKNNDIPSIRVDKENIEDELYEENGIEYIQILLEENIEGKYEFNILSDYGKKDMRFRIKNASKDDIAYIDNFSVDDGVCKIEYNYEKNKIEQRNSQFIPFLVKLLILVLISIIVVGIIAYNKQRRDM